MLPDGVLTRVQVSPERIMQAGVAVEPERVSVALNGRRVGVRDGVIG